MINVVTMDIFGECRNALTEAEVKYLFDSAILDGRLDRRWWTKRPLAQAILLEKIGDIKLRFADV